MNQRYIEKQANKVIFVLAVVIATLVTFSAQTHLQKRVEAAAQEHLAQEVLRLHILANSNSEEDQALKMQVKEVVFDWLAEVLPEGLNGEQTKLWLRSHSRELERVSHQALVGQDVDYPVNVAVTTCYFPDKRYGDVVFPAGNYEALRIEIGAAKGENWWCVLYPGLCFVESIGGVVTEEGQELLQEALTATEYAQITVTSEFKITWFFKEIFK